MLVSGLPPRDKAAPSINRKMSPGLTKWQAKRPWRSDAGEAPNPEQTKIGRHRQPPLE